MPMLKQLITVVETRSYSSRAEKLMTEEERFGVVSLVAEDPECGVVLRETGGIRKVRYGIGGRGKSGGVRVVYFFHDLNMPVFLLTVFAKNEKANLTAAERNTLKSFVEQLVASYKR